MIEIKEKVCNLYIGATTTNGQCDSIAIIDEDHRAFYGEYTGCRYSTSTYSIAKESIDNAKDMAKDSVNEKGFTYSYGNFLKIHGMIKQFLEKYNRYDSINFICLDNTSNICAFDTVIRNAASSITDSIKISKITKSKNKSDRFAEILDKIKSNNAVYYAEVAINSI